MSSTTSSDFGPLMLDSLGRHVIQSIGANTLTIDQLADVHIVPPLLNGQILQWDATNSWWTNVDISLATSGWIENTISLSGTGAQTSFTIPHGFTGTPTKVFIEGNSIDANDDFSWSVDTNNITITYTFPPPSGTNNLLFYYRVS